MKFNELKKELKKRGIKVENTMKKEDLQKLYDESELKIKTVESSILGTDKMSTEELLENTVRTDAGAKRKSGIIIPNSALNRMSRSKFQYVADCVGSECRVAKIDRHGKEHPIRVYSKERHGENFKELAEMFVNKNNK